MTGSAGKRNERVWGVRRLRFRSPPSGTDGDAAELVVTLVGAGARAVAHCEGLARYANSWLTTSFDLEVDSLLHAGEATPDRERLDRESAASDLNVLITDTDGVLEDIAVGERRLLAAADPNTCLHLDLERSGDELERAIAGQASHANIIVSRESVCAPGSTAPRALTGFMEGILLGLFRAGLVGVDYADFRTLFDNGPWRAYSGYGRATGSNRRQSAFEEAISGLETNAGSDFVMEAAVVTVALPPNGTISEFEYAAAVLAEHAPQATTVVAAPMAGSDALEVGLIAARRLRKRLFGARVTTERL